MKFLYYNFQMPSLLKDEKEIAGGAAVQWLSWIGGFLKNGHEFGLLTWKGAKEFINKELEFDIIESYDPNYGISNIRLFYYQFPKLLFAIKKYNPDYIIQSSATSSAGVLMVISKILGIPFIHRIASDVHVDERLISKKEIHLYKLGVRYADYILTQNHYQYDKLQIKYPKKNIYILHNPFNLETNEKDILPFSKRKYVSWVGNFRSIKNLPALIDITTKLSHVEFKIAGAKAIGDSETNKAIEILKTFSNVEFVGYLNRRELKSFLAHSIALLNTSYTEGFSNTFLEAWSLGVPVITTKNVNPDDIINKYEIGKVANDYNQIPEMITEIIKYNPSDFENLALRCYNYVKENHDPVMLVDKLVSFLQKNIGD